jgi:hypothetical protein
MCIRIIDGAIVKIENRSTRRKICPSDTYFRFYPAFIFVFMFGREIYFVYFWMRYFFATYMKNNIKKTLSTIWVKSHVSFPPQDCEKLIRKRDIFVLDSTG